MKRILAFLAILIAVQSPAQIKFSQLGNGQNSSDASARVVGIENVGGVWNNVLFFPSQINKGRMDSIVTAFGTYYLKTAADARFVHYTDTSLMLTNYKHWNSGYITRASADARYLQSENDPHRLLYFTVSGTNTKTLVATLADSTKVSIAWTDLQGTGGGSFTFTGTASQYVGGDGSYITFPTIPTTTNQLTNNSGFITSTALSPYLTSATAASTYATQSALATTNSNVTSNTTAIGTLSGLTTTAKSNLVAAINEVNAKPTGGSSSTSAKVFYLSLSGCVSDADLSMNSTTLGTDNTSAIQTVINNAPSGSIIYVDGRYSATQIKIKPNLSIIGTNPSNGFIQRTNSDKPFIINFNRSGTSIVDSNIVLQNLIINGNGYTSGGVANQAKTSIEGWTMSLRMSGVKNLKVKDVILLNPRTFCSYVNNFEDVVFENIVCTVAASAPYGNGDGVKFGGYFKGLVLKNLSGSTKDDLFSICANDGFQSTNTAGTITDGPSYDPSASRGACTDFVVDGVNFLNSYQGFRILSISDRIDRGAIRNIKGSLLNNLIGIIDNYSFPGQDNTTFNYDGVTTAGNVGKITFEDINVTCAAGAGTGLINIGLSADELVFNNITRDDFTTSERSIVVRGGTISTLRINDYKSKGAAAVDCIEMSGGTVNSLVINDAQYDRGTAGSSASSLFKLSGGTLGSLRINGAQGNNLASLVNYSAGTLTQVLASNVLLKNMTTPFIACTPTLPKLTFSNFDGTLTHTGTITAKQGDAFTNTAGGSGGSGIANDLLAYYDLNETSGNRADKVATTIALVPTNGVSSSTGKLGNGASFTAASSQYLLGDATQAKFGISNTTGFAISAWVKLTPGTTQVIAAKDKSGGTGKEWLLYYDFSQGKIYFNVSTNGTTWTNTVSLPFTPDGSNFVFVGAQVNTPSGGFTSTTVFTGDASNAVTSATFSSNFFHGTGTFRIGGHEEDPTYMNGIIDEVGIWKNQFTTARVTALYNGGAGAVYPW
jgi:hypothetical protein